MSPHNRAAPGRHDAGTPCRWANPSQRSRGAASRRTPLGAVAGGRLPILLRALAALAILVATGWQGGFGAAAAEGAAPHAPVTASAFGLDSDGDRLSDAAEFTLGTDPLDGDGDADADGLTDRDEIYRYGTDPNNRDTDGDGLPDGDEVLLYGSNPLGSDTGRDGLGVAEDLPFASGVRRLWDIARVDASGARLLPHGGADP